MIYTARQAFHASRESSNALEAVFIHITRACMDAIRQYSQFHFTQCTYTIPSYVMGFSLYDIPTIREKIVRHLKTLEYNVHVSQKRPATLIVSWGHF